MLALRQQQFAHSVPIARNAMALSRSRRPQPVSVALIAAGAVGIDDAMGGKGEDRRAGLPVP